MSRRARILESRQRAAFSTRTRAARRHSDTKEQRMEDYQEGATRQVGGRRELIDLIPSFADGTPLAIGDRVRVSDGSIIRVRSVVLAEGGALVSGTPIEAGKLGLVSVAQQVSSADEDSAEALDADCELTPNEYCHRRALDVEGDKPADKMRAMVADVRARQAALSRG